MNYNDYSNPKGGYKNQTDNKGYNSLLKPEKIKAEDFSYLSTIYNGIGDYHTNHFIAYFEPQEDKFSPKASITLFYEEFCKIFSIYNIAKVVKTNRTFKGKGAYKFTIGGNIQKALNNVFEARHKSIGFVHDDWVQMQKSIDQKSFYGTTLKREWDESLDSILIDSVLSEINKKHFLAGRRSWAIGYDESLKLFFVETAALERSSEWVYNKMEQLFDLRQDIIDLWTNLLENYATNFNIKFCDIGSFKYSNIVPVHYTLGEKKIKYNIKKNVAFASGSNEKFIDAVSTGWFSKVLKRHPGLITDL